MHQSVVVAAALLAAALPCQSPLTTTFVSNNGGSVGGAVYFDLQVNVAVTITQIDLNLSTAATTPGTINVYTIPTTHVGSEANLTLWTQMTSGPATSNGNNVPTPVTLTPPLVLAPGSHGIALQGVGHSHSYTNGTGPNQVYSNAELTLTAGAALNVAFSGVPFTPRVVNCSLHYTVGGGFASALAYGQGCLRRMISFYESFPVSTFNLGSSTGVNAIMMVPTGGGYVVLPAAPNWFTPISPDLLLADDAISPAQPLPFTFPYPGGSTGAINVESNGNVWLQTPAHASFICNTAPSALLTRGPVICAFYDDLDATPATGSGSIHCDIDSVNNVAYCTWLGVPIWTLTPASPRPVNTFQVALHSSGMIELRWQGMNSTGSWTSTLCGFSPGAGNLDPGQRSISTSMPFNLATDRRELAMVGVGRPVIGNATFALEVRNIPATSTVGALILSFTRHDPGLPLAPLGMPECSQYVGLDSSRVVIWTGSPTQTPVPVPANNLLAGLLIRTQAAAFDPGVNALGVLASNGVELSLNTQ